MTFQGAGQSAGWFNQIGLTSTIENQANGGAGVTIALVDTGVVPTNAEITGRVLSTSSCAAVSFTCPNGFIDDNGHGTATASIAAGRYGSGGAMSGVAPAANILSEKVLSASGSGYDTDVANGIIKAANAGAPIISLSVTYVGTSYIVNAINYATSKGSVIVWAGGNSSTGLNSSTSTSGLSPSALNHLIFVGSVNSNNTLSSFSNVPGSGYAIAGTSQASYASLWIMAPGESIVAPEIAWGPSTYAYWTGTSMSAPEVAGALALLEATWPILRTNGDATAVLFSSATDLGAAGVDSVYGHGLLSVSKAFQPSGFLSVSTVSGASVPVSLITSTTLASGALGSLPSIQAQLSNYTAFDIYQRNFLVNLSGLVTSASTLTASLAATTAPVSGSTVPLPGGGHLMLALSGSSPYDVLDTTPGALIVDRGMGARDGGAFLLSLTSRGGSTVAVGRGLPATRAFAGALWGEGVASGFQSDELGVSNALMGMAQGGAFVTMGANLTGRARLAVAWSNSPAPGVWNLALNNNLAQSSNLSVGMSVRLSRQMSGGVTLSSLTEKNGFLGSAYDVNGLLSLGASHKSSSVALSWTYNLGGDLTLLAEGLVAKTSGGAITSGLLSSISPTLERAYGVSLAQANALRPGDRLTLSVTKPLKVISGSAEMLIAGVDDNGYPTSRLVSASLKPNGDETDVGLSYGAAFNGGTNLSAGLAYRAQVDNIRGLDDVRAKVSFSARF